MSTLLTEALNWRYATKTFDTTKPVSESDLQTILEAGNLMPTAYGLQPFRFVVVSDKEKKQSLVAHSYGQAHVADNSHLIVLAVRTDIDEAFVAEYTARIERVRGLPTGSTDGYKTMMVGDLTNRSEAARLEWAKKQTYIALGGLIAGASLLQVDNHALEGFDVAAYNEVLGLTEMNLSAAVILAIGYRSEADESQNNPKVRRELDELVVRI